MILSYIWVWKKYLNSVELCSYEKLLLLFYFIFVISPAATVAPSILSVTLPSCFASLGNSTHIGLWVVISMVAFIFSNKHLGFFLVISPVLRFNWAMSFVMVAGSTSDCWCRTTGMPMVIGTLMAKITTWASKREETGTGCWGLHTMSPIAMFCWSIPESVKAAWSPAKAWETYPSSTWIAGIKWMFENT